MDGPCKDSEWTHGKIHKHCGDDGLDTYEHFCPLCGRRWPASYGSWRAQQLAKLGRCWKTRALGAKRSSEAGY